MTGSGNKPATVLRNLEHRQNTSPSISLRIMVHPASLLRASIPQGPTSIFESVAQAEALSSSRGFSFSLLPIILHVESSVPLPAPPRGIDVEDPYS